MDNGKSGPTVNCVGLASDGHRTYCVVHAKRLRSVTRLMQIAMLPSRILRIIDLDTNAAKAG
jgi:hypothetical protein